VEGRGHLDEMIIQISK